MRNVLIRSLLGLFVLWVSGEAKDWPAIPPEVWTIKQDGGLNAQGAVILDEWVRYGEKDTEVRRRIRIFGETGKGAASLPSFNHLFEIEGRTVQPNGEVTSFNSAKDLVSSSFKIGGVEAKQQSLIPPGLTANCVVDLRYRVGSYVHGTWSEIPILGTYPVMKKSLELPLASFLDSTMVGVRGFSPERNVGNGYETWTFKNLPVNEPEPYASSAAGTRPLLVFSYQPIHMQGSMGMGPAFYWNEVGSWYRRIYSKYFKFGRTFQEWSKALRVGLEGDAPFKAGAILMRLEEQIQNGSQLTYAEFAVLPKKVAEEQMEAHDLDAAIKRRRTSALGMQYLFFQLLVDEGIEPKLLLVADQHQRIFQVDFLNLNQFTDVLIGVASKSGGMAWFAPSTRYFPAGIVHPAYQGTKGLLVDSRDWTIKYYVLGTQGPKINVKLFVFDLSLDREERFSLKARFSGYPEFLERNKFFSLESKEQERKLKESVASGLNAYGITKAVVEHATDARKNLVWILEGSKEAEDGRRRVISPFPGLSAPLHIPDAWPETRKSPILLPYCQVFGAISRFKVPQGWILAKEQDFVQSNEIGTVTWKMKSIGNEHDASFEMTFSVEVKHMLFDAASYAALRTFLTWVESAHRRTLTLELK